MASLAPGQLLAEIERFASAPPENTLKDDVDLRTKLYHALGKAKRSLETPTDLVTRLLLSQHVESTLINIALDLELFYHLQENSGNPKTLDILTTSIKAHPVFLKRLLRALAAFGAVREVGESSYALSPSHSMLANKEFGHAMVTVANILHPTYQALPQYLKSKEYEAPADPKNTVVQKVFEYKDQELMSILMGKPDWARAFGMLMSTWGESHALLQHLYPIKERLIDDFNAENNSVIFVDVGGNYGQKSIALKQSFPELPGKVLVQDLPMFINTAPEVEGIEFMVHDFFMEQPIKGAKCYYIRQCLHDWPDEACVKIISNLRPALKPGYSKLLIHELIVPEVGASTWDAVQDVNMMALCGIAERTEEDWRRLIRLAGLSVENIYYATDGVSESVIEVVSEE